jgi:invasion protein IalB
MRSFYPAVCSIISLILAQNAHAGAISSASTPRNASRMMVAQATPSPSPSASPTPETRPAERVETINFENWILTCRELVEGPKKRSCAMTVAVNKSDTNRPVLSWTIRHTDNGQLVSVIETLPGISITPGIQLKLEKAAAPRKFPIEVCEPNWCSGSLPMDKGFVQEVSASSKVTIIITSSAGQPFTFEFPIKGFEKAYAKM